MSSLAAAKAAQAGRGVIGVHKKYTVQSVGIWERIRRALAIDPNRSNGVPLNPQFRNPPPGAVDPFAYTDPVTLPAADIAENPYYGRDVRRAYPRISVLSQGDVVGLLEVGSAKEPKKELIGDAGKKELVAVGEEAQKGLSAYLKEHVDAKAVLESDGLPPLPSGLSLKKGHDKYHLTEEPSYPEEYPCRTFA